ncbi:hypothetical protein BB560_000192 [Smittium megazygosporum]|uniref:FAD-binding PCMH-type domain-containing protein n=1 Tax=Smittium megazygosporum TaxID=133381 RepID=A0A2T9ZL77_9FUNG|nr:hypothetical protein BB560_000194 [Smittium megazygosporum]PVV05293.1 hypothetical protein BB560_000192 [Smittium megazygosporum]
MIPPIRPIQFSSLTTKPSPHPIYGVHRSKTSTRGVKVRYFSTKPVRNPNFIEVTKEDVKYFESVLGVENVLATEDLGGRSDIQDLDQYNSSWIPEIVGNTKVVILPTSTQHVSEGGNTGAQGACIPVFDEIVVCMSRMNSIRKFDIDSGVLECDAGCILEQLDNHVSQFNFTMPLDLGAKGSCHIGGNISTNAGGVRYLRYGSLHGSVLGLEVVLPDGTILNNMSTLRKDSTGYDIKQLFIGAEGTLGIVTGVSILTSQKPLFNNVVLLGLNSFEDVLKAFNFSKKHFAEILSAFEFWDADCMKSVLTFHKYLNPFSSEYNFYVLIETSGSNSEHDQSKINLFLEESSQEGFVVDGTMAYDSVQDKKTEYLYFLFSKEINNTISLLPFSKTSCGILEKE